MSLYVCINLFSKNCLILLPINWKLLFQLAISFVLELSKIVSANSFFLFFVGIENH